MSSSRQYNRPTTRQANSNKLPVRRTTKSETKALVDKPNPRRPRRKAGPYERVDETQYEAAREEVKRETKANLQNKRIRLATITSQVTGNPSPYDKYYKKSNSKSNSKSSAPKMTFSRAPSKTVSRGSNREVLRSERIEGLSDEDSEFLDSILMAFFSDSVHQDSYEIGGKNEYYASKKEKASRVKSLVPKKLPPVKFRPGPIQCPFEYDEMLRYYHDRQLKYTTANRPDLLQELENQFIYTYPTPPQPEDYNNITSYSKASKEWLNNEEIRLETGLSPACALDASTLIQPVDIDPTWRDNHLKLIQEYEAESKIKSARNPDERRLLPGTY